MRYVVAIALVLCQVGCGTDQQFTTNGYDFSAHGRRVFLHPIELELSEKQLWGKMEPRPDWVAAAKPGLQEALIAELAEHGAEVVTDPEADADYVLVVRLDDWFESAALVTTQVAATVIIVPLLLLSGQQPDLDVSSEYPPSASASLEVYGSHDIAWQAAYTSGIPDVRSENGAKAMAQLLLRELPWSR